MQSSLLERLRSFHKQSDTSLELYYTDIYMDTDLLLILIFSITKVHVLIKGVALFVEITKQLVQRTKQQISIVEKTEHFRAKSSTSLSNANNLEII